VKPSKGMKYENHWGTVIELLGHNRIIYSQKRDVYQEIWEIKILKSGEPRLPEGNIFMVSNEKIAEWGFKPLKMYGTKLWKVLND
jgi:hypothetical protein